MPEGRILIVRHGSGRSRHADYMRRVLADLQERRPGLYGHLAFYATGEPHPDLDGICAVVFWLQDSLRTRFPACYRDAVEIAAEARSLGLRLINPPEALADSRKSAQAQLWKEAGIPTPDVERFETADALKRAADRFCYPVFARTDEHHAQKATKLFGSREALLRAGGDLPFPCAISPFVDVRAGYRDTDPASLYAKLFHKKRLIVAGDIIRTKHILFSREPVVSAETSLYRLPKPLRWLEPLLPAKSLTRQCAALDLAFWRQGEDHRALMRKACSALGFQLAAIDYSTLAGGTPILWEANPFFGIPKCRAIMLPRLRHATERVVSYHDAIGDFLEGLMEEESEAGARQVAGLQLAP